MDDQFSFRLYSKRTRRGVKKVSDDYVFVDKHISADAYKFAFFGGFQAIKPVVRIRPKAVDGAYEGLRMGESEPEQEKENGGKDAFGSVEVAFFHIKSIL